MTTDNKRKYEFIQHSTDMLVRGTSDARNPRTISDLTAPYLFSTENLTASYRVLRPAGRRVLTVAGSGDHIFDAYLHGAAHVDAFDINIFQECVLRLKCDLIHRMSHSQFMTFFFGTMIGGDKQRGEKMLAPYMRHLSPEARAMMDAYYAAPSDKPFFRKTHFIHQPYGYKYTTIGYLQTSAAFEQLKRNMPDEISFTRGDIRTIARNTTANYDIIHLSNVMDYCIGNFDNPNQTWIKYYLTTVIVPLLVRLAPGGTMVTNYLWDAFCTPIDDPSIHRIYCHTMSQLAQALPDIRHTFATFPSARVDTNRDAILMLSKTR